MRTAPITSSADKLYLTASRRAGGKYGPRRMSRTTRAIIAVIADNPGMNGSTVARLAGANQGNVARETLPMLKRFRLIESELGEPDPRGGRTPIEWYLTGDGKQVAQAIAEEETP